MKADFTIILRKFLNSKGEIGAEQLAEVLSEAVREVIPKIEKSIKMDNSRNAGTREGKANFKAMTK